MQFADLILEEKVAGQPVTIRITGSAIHALWGAGVGPQDASGIVAEHRDMIEDIAVAKLRAGQVDAGEIVVSDVDLDM